jgi:type IV pilus assembly protein PilO
MIAGAGGFWTFVWKNQMPKLERAQAEERELRSTFEAKQRKAANFTAYKAQLAEIERSFGTMLRQLPGKTEIPNLLVDISQTGRGAGTAGRALPAGRRRPQGFLRRKTHQDPPVRLIP